MHEELDLRLKRIPHDFIHIIRRVVFLLGSRRGAGGGDVFGGAIGILMSLHAMEVFKIILFYVHYNLGIV
jgi:hypothetical protein